MTEMTPAQRQLQVHALSSAGRPPIVTAGDPGTQGEAVAGMQGFGVKGGVLTAGFAGLLHRPNGLMFAKGAKSMIVGARALGRPARIGAAARADGAPAML